MLAMAAHHLRRRHYMTCLVSAIHDDALRHACAALHGRLLDIGCGTKPYRPFTAPYVDEHVGLEHAGTRHGHDAADLMGTAYDIPAAPASFDSVLCTAVLEHLEEPAAALRECARVLRPGGVAVYTVPFIWHEHEGPRDFYRYSRFGLRHLFERAGFEVVEIRALSGFWVTFGQLLVYNLYRVTRRRLRFLRWLRVVPIAGLAVQAIAALLDAVDRDERWTWMHLVVARKCDRTPPASSPAPAPSSPEAPTHA